MFVMVVFPNKSIFCILKGGEPDLQTSAKMVLYDWQRGKIPFFTPPPQREEEEKIETTALVKPDSDEKIETGEKVSDDGEEEHEDEGEGKPGEVSDKLVKEMMLEFSQKQQKAKVSVAKDFFDPEDCGDSEAEENLSEEEDDDEEEDEEEEDDGEEDDGGEDKKKRFSNETEGEKKEENEEEDEDLTWDEVLKRVQEQVITEEPSDDRKKGVKKNS